MQDRNIKAQLYIFNNIIHFSLKTLSTKENF